MTSQAISVLPAARSQSFQEVLGFIEPPSEFLEKPELQRFARQASQRAISGFSDQHALRIIRQGISSRILNPLSTYLEVGKGELAVILDLDRTTVHRRADKDLPLPRHSAEGVLRLLELKDLACETFESEEAALRWLRRAHPLLEGESPLEAASTSFGSRRVRNMLIAIQYGGVV